MTVEVANENFFAEKVSERNKKNQNCDNMSKGKPQNKTIFRKIKIVFLTFDAQG